MKIELDKRKKVTLLNWLKQGFIETDDVQELKTPSIEIIHTYPQTDPPRQKRVATA